MDEDRALVDRARLGDEDAFGDLVRKYQHRIVNFARALVAETADAEDVAQEAFLRAFRALRQFRGQSSFKTWLYQIAANTARTHAGRRRAKREVQPLDSPRGGPGETESGAVRWTSMASPEDVEADVIRRDQLDRALASLPVELRETVVLRDVEGWDYREIATALDIPIGTVESRIFRARQRLRRLL